MDRTDEFEPITTNQLFRQLKSKLINRKENINSMQNTPLKLNTSITKAEPKFQVKVAGSIDNSKVTSIYTLKN